MTCHLKWLTTSQDKVSHFRNEMKLCMAISFIDLNGIRNVVTCSKHNNKTDKNYAHDFLIVVVGCRQKLTHLPIFFWLSPLILNSSPLVSHICVGESDQHWFRQWFVAYSAPSYYLNQCWVIVNWPLRNKLQWNFRQIQSFSMGHFVQGRWVKKFTVPMTQRWRRNVHGWKLIRKQQSQQLITTWLLQQLNAPFC